MSLMPSDRTWLIAAKLLLAFPAILIMPIVLIWQAIHVNGWDNQNLKVRFDAVRYEEAGLVFTYTIENRAYRTARLLPEQTRISALQEPDRPIVGFANLSMPLVIEAHSEQRVEIRLELPAGAGRWKSVTEEQTRRVLHNDSHVNGPADAPVS